MRYNIFNQIHKALRTILFDTATILQQTDFSNKEESTESVQRLREVIHYFEKHAYSEDNFVLPAIEKFEPSLVDLFEKEHVEDHELGEKMNALLKQFDTASTEHSRMAIGTAINSAFIEFLVFNLNHMAKEEDILNAVLWKHYSDAELHGITQQIVAHNPPELMAVLSKWMMRSLNNPEITHWLKEVKENSPEVVFGQLVFAAEKELTTHRWLQVQESLTEGSLLA